LCWNDPTPREEENLQLNDQALNVIYGALDTKVFKSIKDLEMAHEVWKRLEDSHDVYNKQVGMTRL
jgi:hypothetical protein